MAVANKRKVTSVKKVSDFPLSKLRGTDGKNGEIGQEGRQGSQGLPGTNGTDGRDGRDGLDGPPGRDGVDGKDGQKGIQGPQGQAGPAPEHRWKGNSLQFKNPDGTWGKSVDLTGPQGAPGRSRGGGGGSTPDDVAEWLRDRGFIEGVYAKRIDFDGTTITYIAEAVAGSAEGDPVWRIKRITTNVEGDATTEWADGNTDFDNIYTNRTGLTYS